jgi:hypothetical protein
MDLAREQNRSIEGPASPVGRYIERLRSEARAQAGTS